MNPLAHRFILGLLSLCLFPLLVDAKTTQAKPSEWAKFRTMQQADEKGVVKPDGLLRALERRRQLVRPATSADVATGFALGPAPAAGISSALWRSIGPSNIGGRVRAVAVHPTQPNTVWIGAATGGLWKTTDGGASWSPASDFMGNLSISEIVVAPNNPNVMYVSFLAGRICKSSDGGSNWLPLTAASDSCRVHCTSTIRHHRTGKCFA